MHVCMCACAMVSGDGTQILRLLRRAHQALLLAEPYPQSGFLQFCQGESSGVKLENELKKGVCAVQNCVYTG